MDEPIKVLSGWFHFCPICFSQLSFRSMPILNEQHWHCTDCGTEWEVGALIDAMNYKEEEEKKKE